MSLHGRKKMKYFLGLDIGITSVGWGVIDKNNNIIKCGVRLFDEADQKNNADRRAFRGSRRLIRRRKLRIDDVKSLLMEKGLINNKFKPFKDPYKLRKKGLTEKLTDKELATVLLFYAKRRGSSLEVAEEITTKSEESTKFILNENKQLLKKEGFIVDVQLKRKKELGSIRGINNVFKTEDYLYELKAILNNQNLDENFKKELIEIIFRRRHFSEGPGNLYSPSPYGRYRLVEGKLLKELKEYLITNFNNKYLKEEIIFNYEGKNYLAYKNGEIVNKDKYDLIALMRGNCSIYEDEFRAPKNAFSAELFNLLNDLNNLKFTNREEKITGEEKHEVINVIREKGNITFNQLLKLLGVTLIDVTGYRIDKNDKPILTEFNGYKKVLKIIKDLKKKMLDDETIDQIMEILTETVVVEERFDKINRIVKDELLAMSLSNLTGINGYHNLSLKAIYQLKEELLITSLNQQQIITNKNLTQKTDSSKLVLDESAILSPVARRAHREALRVVDELSKEYGTFDTIIIETTRDKNSADQRKRIRDTQKYFEKSKKEAEEVVKDYDMEVISSSLILKLRLYKEQHGKCAYSGKSISLGTLIRDHQTYQIDHIIPLSISFDDSYNNKVLITALENQRKANKTPFGYFVSGMVDKNNPINNWNDFETTVKGNTNYSSVKKRNLLFKKDISKYEVLEEFKNRNIVDTSYAVRSLMTTLRNYYQSNEIDTKVRTIRGKQTNHFRKIGANLWFHKYQNSKEVNPFLKDRNKYIHHVIDALIIAGLSKQNYLRSLYRDKMSLNDDLDEITKAILNIDSPYNDPNLKQYLLQIASLKEDEINYSWKIDTKINRTLADQTIYSTRIVDDVHRVVKKYDNIYELNNERLEKVFSEKQRENLLVFKHDPQTYEILYKAYMQYAHEKYPFKAYYEEHGFLQKYAKNNNGPVIKQLKYLEDKLGSHLDITPQGAIDKKVVKLQVKSYRADIYYSKKENRYKFITIRHSDIVLRKGSYLIEEDWYNKEKKKKEINESYQFLFSLNRNNIIEITKLDKKDKIVEISRFIGVNNDIANKIEVKPLNYYEKKQLMPTIGRNTLKIRKFNVSLTGKIAEAVNEPLKLVF